MSYSKNNLKKMFLVSLDNCFNPKIGGSHDATTIINVLIELYFNIKLTKEEKELARICYEEMKRDGLIIQDPKQSHSSEFSILTDEGKEVLEEAINGDFDFSVSRVQLKDIMLDKYLIKDCKNDFDNGEYWDSVFSASRHVEERIRKLGRFDASIIGEDLVNKAFHPTKGMFKIISCATRAEEEGIHAIMRGMVLFHRNAKGHRKEDMDRVTAIRILGYFDYILSLVKTAQKR